MRLKLDYLKGKKLGYDSCHDVSSKKQVCKEILINLHMKNSMFLMSNEEPNVDITRCFELLNFFDEPLG